MAIKGKKIDGFIADMKVFQKRVLPKTFVAFQKYIALELYKRIMQKRLLIKEPCAALGRLALALRILSLRTRILRQNRERH